MHVPIFPKMQYTDAYEIFKSTEKLTSNENSLYSLSLEM